MNELETKLQTTSMTVRLNSDISDKFKTSAKEKKISQGEFIEELMECYEKEINVGDLQVLEPQGNELITLLLKYKNVFENKTIETKKITFKGEIIYRVANPKWITISGKERLMDEFKITKKLENINCSYWWGITKELDKERYIIYENFHMEGEKQEILLNIKRCKVAKKLNEIIVAIENYALEMDIEQLEYILAKTISDEKELIAYLN